MSTSHEELSQRESKAQKIIDNPTGYKICEGCDSIVIASAVTCPSCNAYRFDESPDAIIEQAKLLGSRERKTVIHEDFL